MADLDDVRGRLNDEIDRLKAENSRLAAMVFPHLTSAELKVVDRHCDWKAFMHAFNAVMKLRREKPQT